LSFAKIVTYKFKGEKIMSQNRTSTDFPGTAATTGDLGSSQTGTAGSSNAASSAQPGTGTGTATALAQEYGSKITEAASQAKDYVSDKMSVVGDKIKDLQNADLSELTENAKDYARQNPGQAILISAAAGLLVGLIIRGRR
jgi:ElaB/YqjD/DUF883 family membrane-anchored ribosome-binding protein